MVEFATEDDWLEVPTTCMEKRNDIGKFLNMLVIDVKSIAHRAAKGKLKEIS